MECSQISAWNNPYYNSAQHQLTAVGAVLEITAPEESRTPPLSFTGWELPKHQELYHIDRHASPLPVMMEF